MTPAAVTTHLGPLPDPLRSAVCAFVHGHPRASLYHTPRWVDFASSVFGLQAAWIVAHDTTGALEGVLPLVRQSSLAFGRRWVSLPFFNYGGPLASDSTVDLRLIQASGDLGRQTSARTVEIRDTVERPGLAVRTDKVSPVLALPASTEALGKSLGAKLRSQARRADRESPSVHIGGAELVPEFFAVFAPTMRDLGTPVYPRAFFERLMSDLAGDSTLIVIRLGGRPAAAALLTQWRDTVEIPWAASLRALRGTSVNMRLYWECLCWAIQHGATTFDFGRSTIDAGTYRFKLQWGATPRPLYWYYPMEPAGPRPTSSDSRAVAAARQVWTQLPVPLANAIGRMLSPGLPW